MLLGRPFPRPHPSLVRRRRPGVLPVLVVVLVTAAALAGCGAQDEEVSLASLEETPIPTQVPEGTELVFGDQNEEVQTLMAASGQHQELASETTYANFLGGPQILEAIRADAVDVAFVGDTPPIQAQAAGELVPIVTAVQTSAPDYRLAVRPGLEVGSLEELDGLKIAYAEGTGRQPFVLRALEKGGLDLEDVELVPLDVATFPDAVRDGQVDVAPLNEPHLSRYLGEAGASEVPFDELEGLSHGLQYLYVRGGALADEGKAAAVRDFVQRFVAAWQWSEENPDDWVQAYFVDAQQLSAEDGHQILESQGEISFPALDEDLVALQQDTIDVIDAAGGLPEELDASEEFALSFADVVAEAVEESGAKGGTP